MKRRIIFQGKSKLDKVICLLLINILFSCNFFSPIEENIQTQNVEFSEKEISFNNWIISGGERKKIYGKSL